jgi:hypothetical protein
MRTLSCPMPDCKGTLVMMYGTDGRHASASCDECTFAIGGVGYTCPCCKDAWVFGYDEKQPCAACIVGAEEGGIEEADPSKPRVSVPRMKQEHATAPDQYCVESTAPALYCVECGELRDLPASDMCSDCLEEAMKLAGWEGTEGAAHLRDVMVSD